MYDNDMNSLEKTKHSYLLELFVGAKVFSDILKNSKIFFEIIYRQYQGPNVIKLYLTTHPTTFIANQNHLKGFKEYLKEKYELAFDEKISHIEIKPDLEKYKILDDNFVPQPTPWQSINDDQNILLQQLKSARSSIEYQNIGNTCRTIIQKLADIVYSSEKHIHEAYSEPIPSGKYKHRLEAYIKTELKGKEHQDIRGLALSIIKSFNETVDLANVLAHDTKAGSFMAESSVIGVLSTIGIIRLIEKGMLESV